MDFFSKTKNSIRLTMILGALLLLMQGCVDKDFDLNNGVSSDMLLAQNGLFLPIGSSDSITLKRLMENADITGLKVENGKYFVVYGDSLNLNVPTQNDLKIKDIPTVNSSIQISGNTLDQLKLLSQAPLSKDVEFDLSQDIGPFSFQTSSEIQRLDSVALNTDGNNSRININLNTVDLGVSGGEGYVDLSLNFPSNFTVVDPSTGNVLAGNTYEVVYPVSQTSKSISLILKSFKNTQQDYVVTGNAKIIYKKGSRIVVGNNPGLRISLGVNNLIFKRIFGLFNVNISSNAGRTSFSGLYDHLSGKDNVLSFSQPRIFITTSSNIGIPVNVALTMNAEKNSSVLATKNTSLAVNVSTQPTQIMTNSFGIGPVIENNWTGRSWNYTNINDLFKNSPDALSFNVSASSNVNVSQHFYTDDAYMKIKYEAKVPLAAAQDFNVTVGDTVRDVFTKDLVEKLFSAGTAEIYGNVVSSLPLNLQLQIRMLDDKGNDTGVVIAPQVVNSCKANGTPTASVLSLKIAESEMTKMQNAKDIELKFVVTSSSDIQNMILKQTDFVKVGLFVKKTGGISIN
ncbi:MAG: DUF4621 domain-containing protein [Bacteroidota bacterium]|nr:DUF4621 domain-containing protein [Bacteroidota bacterium]